MNNSYDQTLADSLNHIPQEVGKELMWLVYRGLKPMASIPSKKSQEIIDWIQKAGLFYEYSQKSSHTLHISKDKNLLAKNRKYELLDTQEAHQVRGQLYGFPREAVALFPSNKLVHTAFAQPIMKEYWYPYVAYLVRKGHEYEDSLVAKAWADCVRAEIPEIAADYEQEMLKALKKVEL